MQKQIENTGFRAPAGHSLGRARRTVVFAELLAGVALALSTVVVATVLTVLSSGVARASVAENVIGNEGSLFAIAFLLGLMFIGLGGLSALVGDEQKKR